MLAGADPLVCGLQFLDPILIGGWWTGWRRPAAAEIRCFTGIAISVVQFSAALVAGNTLR